MKVIDKSKQDSQDYLVRGIDAEIWKKARIRAIEEDIPMPEVMRELITMWAKGQVDLDRGKRIGKGGDIDLRVKKGVTNGNPSASGRMDRGFRGKG